MALFLWKKTYEVDIAEIDTQHRRLVGLINELADAMMERRGYTKVQDVIDSLENYIQVHFSTEEQIMTQMNYPAVEQHRQAHLDLTSKFLQMKEGCDSDHCPAAQDLLAFLCDWLKQHILVSDKEFGAFARSLKNSLP